MNCKKILNIVLIVGVFAFLFFNIRNSAIKNQTNNHKNLQTLQTEKIIDDDFISRVGKNDLTYENLNKKYSSAKITYEPYPFHGDRVFQLIVFKSDIDIFKFFKSTESLFLLKGDFFSDKIVLDKDIKIGIEKSVLEKKFNKKIEANTVIVNSMEGYNFFTFIFEKDRLVEIVYDIEDMFWFTD
jgi:hypothetical protein